MNVLVVSQVNVPTEVRAIGIAALLAALLVLAFLAFGLTTLAAFTAALGLLAVLERVHRLFHFFLGQRKYLLCILVAGIAVCAFAAVCWVVYLGTPLHSYRVP